jgi:hypothetical protein
MLKKEIFINRNNSGYAPGPAGLMKDPAPLRHRRLKAFIVNAGELRGVRASHRF